MLAHSAAFFLLYHPLYKYPYMEQRAQGRCREVKRFRKHSRRHFSFRNGPWGVWKKFEKVLLCSLLPGHMGSRQWLVFRQADAPARDS